MTCTPSEIKEEKLDEICRELSLILEMDEKDLREKLTQNSSYVIIKQKITPEQSEKIRNLHYNGIYLTEDAKRYYP